MRSWRPLLVTGFMLASGTLALAAPGPSQAAPPWATIAIGFLVSLVGGGVWHSTRQTNKYLERIVTMNDEEHRELFKRAKEADEGQHELKGQHDMAMASSGCPALQVAAKQGLGG